MKTQRLLQFLLILASGFFIQCTSDPIPGPPGADGIDGLPGIDGVDGVDGTTSCVSCHANSFREPIRLAFASSAHNNVEGNINSSGTVSRSDSQTCSRCHGEQGFVDILFYGEILADYPQETPISCATCHDMHRSFDFETDGNDKAVRTIEPVTLLLDPNTTLDMANSSDELGLSNLCVNCHQPRPSYDIPGPTGEYIVTSTRFGPHYGAQSVLLQGILGANISGSTAYPGAGSAGHRTGASCVACHMEPATAGGPANHTWNPVKNLCLDCHASVPEEVEGFEENGDFDRLKELLIAAGALTEDGDAVRDTFPAPVAQATWNWRYLYQDHSHGLHNPRYAQALLKNSIEALENQ